MFTGSNINDRVVGGRCLQAAQILERQGSKKMFFWLIVERCWGTRSGYSRVLSMTFDTKDIVNLVDSMSNDITTTQLPKFKWTRI